MPLYGCDKDPVFSGDKIDLTHNPLVWWDTGTRKYVIDLANAAGVDRQVKLTLTDEMQTCYTYTHAFLDNELVWAPGIEWLSENVFEVTFPEGNFNSDITEGLTIVFAAARAGFSTT